MNHLSLNDCAEAEVFRAPLNICPNDLNMKGKWVVEHVRDGVVINEFECPNGIVDAGMNALLNVMFDSGSQITAWYIGLIDNASFSALAAGDTASSHAGWIEATAYSESVRQTWTAGSASARSITNSSTVNFSINSTKTIYGIFVISDSTKSGTTGTLWSTAAFGTTVSVQSGDSLRVTYTVSG